VAVAAQPKSVVFSDPASAAATSGTTPAVTKTAKRVSICTPVACEPLSAPRQTLRRTPYPKGSNTQPGSEEDEELVEDEIMEEQQEEEDEAAATEAALVDSSPSTSPATPITPDAQPSPAPATAVDDGAAGMFGSPVAPAAPEEATPAVGDAEYELEEEPSAADMVEAEVVNTAHALDAAMAIAAARRGTCEVEHVSEPAAPAEDLDMGEVEAMEEEEDDVPAEAVAAAPSTPVLGPMAAAASAAATPGMAELPQEEVEEEAAFSEDAAAAATPLAPAFDEAADEEVQAEEEEEPEFVPGPVRPATAGAYSAKYKLVGSCVVCCTHPTAPLCMPAV
jgi:hypothetical protein